MFKGCFYYMANGNMNLALVLTGRDNGATALLRKTQQELARNDSMRRRYAATNARMGS